MVISTLFPWVDLDSTGIYLSLFDLNFFTGLILFAFGLSTIFVGIYHKPKPRKAYSLVVVLIGVISYFLISQIVGEIVEFNPTSMATGILLSSSSSITFTICGLIPAPKLKNEDDSLIKWRIILWGLIFVALVSVTFFSISKVVQSLEKSQHRNNSSVTTQDLIEPTKKIQNTKRNITNTPTPNRQQCTRWSEISLSDVGKTKCVYGIVHDTYWGGDIFYIRFSAEKNSFKFIVLNNYYFKDINGKCVQNTGEIKHFENVLYMEVKEKLTSCIYN